jgi:hypothetical protein
MSSLLVFVFLLLVYKIKMYKLKQKYENQQRRHGSIESNPGQFESLNVTALGSYYPSMTTHNLLSPII